jgi:hypothetical protein
MKHEYVSLSLIVPEQDYLYEVDLRALLGERFNPSKFEHTPVVEYKGRFLLAGGHHRAAVMQMSTRFYNLAEKLPVKILENDEEVSIFCEFSNNDTADRYHTRKSFINRHVRRSSRQVPRSLMQMPVLLAFERKDASLPTASLSLTGASVVATVVPPYNDQKYRIGYLPSERQFQQLSSEYSRAN